jgi:acetyl esterase/lipase
MFQAITSQPFNVLWRTALVRAPRLTPTQVLKWTDPEGPYPVSLDLPSRGKHKIPIFIFIKRNLSEAEAENLPVIIDFHGGGFVLGSCLEQAPFCSKMARDLGAVVITVDYRMGPVDKFPAANEDAEDVLKTILEPESLAGMELRRAVRKKVLENVSDRRREKRERKEAKEAAKRADHEFDSNTPSVASSAVPTPASIDLDRTRIAISGFSSGGNLALNLALHLEDPSWPAVMDPNHPHPIPFLLYYPSFDARQLPSERPLPSGAPKSETPNKNAFWTTVADILTPTYLPRDQAAHPRASPGLAPISAIHNSARMLLVLTGKDSLATQSEEWVRKVEDDATRVEHLQIQRYPTMKHGFTQFPDGWLSAEDKEKKYEIFEKTVEFVRNTWEGK